MKHFIFLRVLKSKTSWGGFEKQLLDYFERVDYSQTRVTLVTNFDVNSQRIRQKGLPVEVKLFPLAHPEKPYMPLGRRYRFLVSLKPDAVVICDGAFTDFILSDFLAAFMASRGRLYSMEVLGAPEPPVRSSKKFFGIIPGIGIWRYKHMLVCGLKGWLCRYNICIGNDVRNRLVSWYGYPKHKTITVYHGLDLKVFSPDAKTKSQLRKQWGIGAADKVIISTARLSREKCIDRLIDAFGEIPEAANAWLFLVGEGPLKSDLEKLAGKKKNAGRIIFTGFQDRVVEFLQMSDIFALPSDIEGLSNAMMEAMAVGLVPVVTDAPGAAEAIRNGVDGFIVEKTSRAILDGLKRVLALPNDEAERMAEEARRSVTGKFNIETGAREALRKLGMAHLPMPLIEENKEKQYV